MYYLIGFILFLVVGGFLMFFAKSKVAPGQPAGTDEEPHQVASDCCGAHEICDFDESLFNQEEIIYFNDEELDKLRNVREDQLTGSQIDDLREVLYTLRTREINKWMTSLSRRHIHLPAILQQEARQLIAEKQ